MAAQGCELLNSLDTCRCLSTSACCAAAHFREMTVLAQHISRLTALTHLCVGDAECIAGTPAGRKLQAAVPQIDCLQSITWSVNKPLKAHA